MTKRAWYILACGIVLIVSADAFGTFMHVDGSMIAHFAREIRANLMTPSINVASHLFITVPPYDAADESAAIHIQMDHRGPGLTDHISGLYCEIDSDQTWNGGACTGTVHLGQGAAHRVYMIGDNQLAYGYEAAMFGGHNGGVAKASLGFLSSFQGSESFGMSVPDQSNTIGFEARVHEDGTNPFASGNWNTSYGLFYANNCITNCYVARKSPFAVAGQPYYKLMQSDNRALWWVEDDGSMVISSPEATAIDTPKNSGNFIFRGHYWDGAAEQILQGRILTVISGTTPSLYFYTGPYGGETLVLSMYSAGINMQRHEITYAGNITQSAATGATYNSPRHVMQATYKPAATAYTADGEFVVVSQADPYIKISVDDDVSASSGTLVDVLDIYDNNLSPHADGGVHLGYPSRGWKSVVIKGVQATGPTEPYACDTTSSGAMVYADDTDDAGAATFCCCQATDDTHWDWRRCDDSATACPYF